MTAAVWCACVSAELGHTVSLADQHGGGLPGQHDAGLPDQSGSRMLPSRQFVELCRKLASSFKECNIISSRQTCHRRFNFDRVNITISCPLDKAVKLLEM